MTDPTTSVVPAVYTLGRTVAERERLRGQADDLLRHSVDLVDRVGMEAGASALDVGCGPAGALELLSRRAGPTGRVVGVEVYPTHAEQARQFVLHKGLDNVEIIEVDARCTGLPSESFDVAHARLVLVNIRSPEEVVAEMARLVKPGGWVILDEADGGAHVCYPPLPAWDRLTGIFHAAYDSEGADIFIGRKLTQLLRGAGLTHVATEARADTYPAGHRRRTILADLVDSMRQKILERGIATASELDEVDSQVRQHLADPATLTMSCLYFLAWGRKPT